MSDSNKLNTSFKSKSFKGGMTTSLMVAIVIVFVVLVNLVINKLNLNFDFTSNSMFSITDETREYAGGITDRIRIYYFAESGQAAEICHKIVEKYDGLGKDMKVIDVDPVLHPNYAESIMEGAGQVNADTVIVVNETNGRTKLVTYEEMIQTEYSIDYSTYQTTSVTYSDVEGQIDAALVYVTTDKMPKVYYTSGHGEASLTDVFTNLITKNCFTIEEIDTITSEAIPDDCDILLINYPANDFTAEDVDMISEYLNDGGKVIFNVSGDNTAHKNIASLLATYGLELVEGTLAESDSHYYYSKYPYYILPQIASGDLTSGVKGVKKVLAAAACGISAKDDAASDLTIKEFLTTTDGSYSKVDAKSNWTKTEADIDGPFSLASLVTSSNTDAQLLVYSAMYMWDDSIIGADTYGNVDLLINSFKVLADVDLSGGMNIPAINLNTVSTLSISSSAIKTHVIIKLLILPLGCLLAGIIIFVLRRRAK